ncbi:MAG: DUF998 domain-containing protein [Hamadaea sp.]|nr:DUF998 domain-containing protein [Hamadaea sp.]
MITRSSFAAALAAVSGTGLAVAALSVMAGHLEADPILSPTAATISDYAATDRGGAVESGMLLTGLSSLLLLAALVVVRAPLTWPVRIGFGVWSVGLLVSAYVPTDPFGMPLSSDGYIHRYASMAAFVGLLIGCGLLVRRLRAHSHWRPTAGPMAWLTGIAAVGGLFMLLTAGFGDRVLIGLAERVLTAAQVIGLLLLAYHGGKLASRALPLPAGATLTTAA